MSIEKFLTDMDKKKEEAIKNQKRNEETKQKQKEEDERYLVEFQVYYEYTIVPELVKVKEKLKEKFEVDFDNTMEPLQHNNRSGKVTMVLKSEHAFKEVQITFIAEGGRRLITVSADVINNLDKRKHVTGGFQGTFEEFKKLNLEEEIHEILDTVYIKDHRLNPRLLQ